MKRVGRSYGITDESVKAKAKAARKSHHPTGTDSFIAIDGEGINLPNNEHRYVLLGIGNEQIEDRNGLDWTHILSFLYNRFLVNYANGGIRIAYVGFFLSYDFDRWLRTMAENRVRMLLTSEGKLLRKDKKGFHYPVNLPYGWQIEMVGKKQFRVRKRYCNCDVSVCDHKKDPYMFICDAGSFFQSSLLKAIDPSKWTRPIVTNAEYELIKKGKESRGDIIDIDIPGEYEKWLKDAKKYNALENEILARLLTVLNNGFKQMGVKLSPRQWFGPGQAAQQWMKNECIPQGKDIQEKVPQWFLECARASYFGGWFELMAHGIIPGITHEYDINSAYPYIIASLPCLLHGQYKMGEGKPEKDTGYVLVYARVSNDDQKSPIGTMLHRERDSRILRPLNTEGWYWLHELKAAENANLISHCHYYNWVSYDPCDCPPPMRNVASLYNWRLKVDKNSPLGKALKFAYNSMYGKFAQSIGHPIFSNPIWASLITAGCRTMILNAIASHPKGKEDVYMVATDAVYFGTPHPSLPISKRLGDWDHKDRNNLALFKPGVYWDDNTRRDIAEKRNPVFKARGFAAADFAKQIGEIDRIFQQWYSVVNELSDDIHMVQRELMNWPEVEFMTRFAMVSCLQAIRRNKWELAGQVSHPIVTQDAFPGRKRVPMRMFNPEKKIWYTAVLYQGLTQFESMPYLKRFGMDDPWSDENEDEFINPDGPISLLIQESLGIKNAGK